MATTDFDFQSTRNSIIQRAFRICGGLTTGETLSAEQITQGNQALNDMVKSWQSDHIFLWSLYPTTMSLSNGTQAYSMPTDPFISAIDKAYMRISNVDTPLDVISWRQFSEISNKQNSGEPTCVAVTWDRDTGLYKANYWPKPNGTYTVFYHGICRLKDWDTATSNGDFQPHWTNALIYGLAADICDEIGVPITERNYITGKSEEYLKRAKRGDKAITDCDYVEPSPWSSC